MAVDMEWEGIEFGLCSTDQVPELKNSLSIGGYPFWYIYHGKNFRASMNQSIPRKHSGVGDEGACMERFMSSRIDKVEENLRTAAMRAKLREINRVQ